MKVYTEELYKKLASSVNEGNKIAIEDTEKSPVDSATDHAKAYWMLGWTWEEIEAILEDSMDFDEKTVEKAIKNTQQYAAEALVNGPFGGLKEGSYVKLKNKVVGKIVNRGHKDIEVEADDDVVKVTENLIDFDESKKLQDAYAMRESAKKLFAQVKGLEPYGSPGTQQLKPTRETPEVTPRISPSLQAPKKTQQHPKEWDLPSDVTNVEQADAVVEANLESLLSLKEKMGMLKKEIDAGNAMIAPYRSELKNLQTQEKEIVQKSAAILAQQTEILDDLTQQKFKRLENILVGYREYITSRRMPGSFNEKQAYMIKLLKERVPEVLAQVEAEVEEFDRNNEQLIETLNKELTVYEFKPHHEQKEQRPTVKKQHVVKFGGWLSKLWNTVKESVLNLKGKIFPKIDQLNNDLEAGLAEFQSQELEAKIKQAMRVK